VNPPSASSPDPTERPAARPEARRLRDLSPQQWKSGIAAWLGWLFDGLDMHLYGLVAAPFVASLLFSSGLIDAANPAHELVKEKSGLIQSAFLVGWALGGGFFGRLGDLIGRSRALSLTILTYAIFTGLSFFAQNWWQLLIFRFLAALGIGGEWAVGSSLLSETWPKGWRPWIAAVLQTGVNLGVLLACLTTYLMADLQPKWVFLVGILPALLVFWIRRNVPEPAEWHAAKKQARDREPGVADLFRGAVRRTTLLTIIVCACGLTAWWAFMFWHAQHLRNLPDLQLAKEAAYAQQAAAGLSSLPEAAKWIAAEKQKVVSTAFFLLIASSIVGNFFAAGVARRLGYRRAISIMYTGFFLAMCVTFIQVRGWESLLWFWFPLVGFFSGVFGLFTMYLPPLFPTLLRTTGAGFCYNIGRIVSAAGVYYSSKLSSGGDFKRTLLFASLLFLPAIFVALILPEPPDTEGDEAQQPVD
jgi:MFS family permease